MADGIRDQILKLEEARGLVLNDATHYSAIIPGILPIVGPDSHIDIRRWGTEFLAEAFASPVLPINAKEALSIQVLGLFKALLETPGQDEAVVKSAIQATASIYGLVFRYITNEPQQKHVWEQMAAIKSNVLKRWDAASTGIRVCCIKFVQRVVQVQTPGIITDPRRPEQNEISLALVPRDHPLIPPPNLEAEASGLLDRLLNVFFEDHSEAVLIDATLNCLSILVRTRQSISNKILSTVLNFNPLKHATSSMSSKEKVLAKSMERTTRSFLMNIYRKNENGPFGPRIKQQVDRLMAMRLELFDEGSRKRGAPVEPTDGLNDAKRARLAAELNGRTTTIPALPPGPVSLAQLYTITTDEALKSFDVTPIPIDLVVKIILPVLHHIEPVQLDEAINAVRSRFLEISRRPPPPEPLIPISSAFEDEEDEEYEPDFEPIEDNEQILNKLDPSPAPEKRLDVDLTLKAFKFPPPPPLSKDEAEELGKGAVSRVFSMMGKLEDPNKATKPGFNRLAGSSYDREAWVTVITRLATRTNLDLLIESKEKATNNWNESLGDSIRERLWKYIIEDFRHRIDAAISWLNEEWYNDRLSCAAATGEHPSIFKPNYEKWALRILDSIIPYLDANDKLLIRFLGEIPEVGQGILTRIKAMAKDPDRISLTIKAIYYLVLFKPPVKEQALDALEDLWQEYEEARPILRPLLAKSRPEVLKEKATPNGIKQESASVTTGSAAPNRSGEPDLVKKAERINVAG